MKRWAIVNKHHILGWADTRGEAHPKWRRHRDLAKPGHKLEVQIVRAEKVGKRTTPQHDADIKPASHKPGRNYEPPAPPHHAPNYCPHCGHKL